MRISHAAERTRRALWVMYTGLTSTRLHKFYTLTLVITLLPLIILHLLALSNTTIALSKLSLILATTNSTKDNSLVVPTVTDQDGQGILRLCNVGQVDCQTITSVAQTATTTATPTPAPTVTSTGTSTPQQVASPLNTVPPVNAGAPPTNSVSITPFPDVAVQPEGVSRPASPVSSQSGSEPAVVSSLSSASASPATAAANSGGGVLIAASPAQTQTQTTSSSSSSTSTAAFIADAPRTTSTTTTSASISEKSSSDDNDGNGNGQATPPETSKTTELTLPPFITTTTTANAGESSSSSSSTTTSSAEIKIEKETDSSVVSSSTESSISAPTTSTTTATSSPNSSTSTNSTISATSSFSSIAADGLNSTPTSSRSKETETDSSSKETEITSAPAVGKDVSVNHATLSSTAIRALPSLVHPDFQSVSESGSRSDSVVSPTVEPTNDEHAITSSPSSTASSSSPSSTSSSAGNEAKDETKDTQNEAATDINKQESSSSRTKESSTPTITPLTSTSKSESESTESSEVPAQATSTHANGDIQRRSPSTPNTHFFSLLHLSTRAFSATPITNSTTGALDGIDVTDVDDTGGTEVTRLGVVCAIAMAFPRDQLQQEWMENLTMAAFYLGMLGVGIAAILNESVAHLITISLSTLLSLLWTGTQLVRTHYMHDQFDAFITRGACSGIDVLPSYWAQRTRLELPILIINALALLLLGVLGAQLLKRYHREGGRGAGRYLYKVVVILRCAVLLGGFLLAASMGIWVHLLFTNVGVVGASGVGLIKALGIVSLVFALPWGVLGWLALNAATPSISGAYNEGTGRGGKWGRWWGKRTMMGLFCGLNVLFLGGWIATFASDVYRAVFLAWTFFAVLSIAGFFVLMGSLGAGVICWMRFARNLQDFDSEKPSSDTMSRAFSTASIDPFGVRPSIHSHSYSGRSHSHVGVGGGPEPLRWDYSNTAEKAWEPFDKASIRQSQFTASEGRQSTVFSYGLRSPAPPMPTRPEYGSSNNSNTRLGLAL